jgi:hypothetical protein
MGLGRVNGDVAAGVFPIVNLIVKIVGFAID